ncbi:alpha/beta-hydrolase [Corynespora cassiicola Philippines]|uniref:Alpha/beta-hydrolase n=1 Tax=Corynespora cassiicola Philippines TaxID=1448308 RepID=A0A2T2NWN5_CORCC|nr:alpha/beta-hydrolase [Corynespora cassiicola Philippines]
MSCPDCFKGSTREGIPEGTIETIAGISTYVAKSPSDEVSPSTIIFITDAFGFNLTNSKLLADNYALRTGCRVLVPDIIPGGGVPADSLELMESVTSPVGILNLPGQILRVYNGIRMMSRFLPFALRTRNIFPSVLSYARSIRSELPPGGKLGAAGFCWGGLQTTKLSAESAVEDGEAPLLDAHFTAHPAGIKIPDEFVSAATKFHVPISVAVGDKDSVLPKDSAEELKLGLEGKFDKDRGQFEVVIYSDCGHGFAVRADPKKTVENKAADEAAQQAVDWFRKHLL